MGINKIESGIKISDLQRKCKRCGKIEYYSGFCEVNITTGEKFPYGMKE